MQKTLLRTLRAGLLVWVVLAMSLSGVLAQNGLQVLGINVPIGTTPTSVTQNFNSLSNGLTVSAAGLLGNVDGTYTNRLTVFSSTGAPDLVNAIVPATGAYSFGNSADRALGANPSSLNSTAGITPITLGVLIRNNSGLRISSMAISYRGEQWYTDASGQSQKLTFDYARVADTGLISTLLGNTLLLLNDLLTTVPFTSVPALDFTSIKNTNLAGFPVSLPTPTELNGNLPENSAAISSVITFTTPIENGEVILLRWRATVPALLDLQSHSLAIDDLVITPTLINNPPQVTGTIPAQTATVGVAVNISTATAFTEPDGQVLSFSATGLPTGLAINPATGAITGTPSVSGTSTVTVTASDPQGNSVSTSFSLQVNQPSATVTPTGQICLGQPLSLSILPLNLPPLAVLTINGPNGVSAVVGGNGTATLATGPGGLPAGTNSLTLTATLLGQTILTVPVAVTVPNAVQSVLNLVTSQTVLQGTTLTLTGNCPTGILNYTSTSGTGTGNPTVPTGATGVQSYTVVCIDGNGCISPISVANVTVVGGGLSLLPGTPTQICLGQPLNLSLLGSGILSDLTGGGANSGLISLSVTGPVSASATVLGPGLLQVTGLPAGPNTLTVTAFLSGTPVANVALTTNVISLPAVQNLVSVSGLTGSTLNLAGTCPTGILNYTSSSGTSGSTTTGVIPVLTGSAGVQSYTVVCLDANGCISPVSVVNVTLVNGTLTPSGVINPVCLGNALSLTLLGGNGLDLNLVSLSVTGVSNLNVVAGGPGVLTINGLPAGTNNLTVTAYLLGAPVASVSLPVTVLSVQPPSVASSPTVGQTYPAGQTSVSVTQGANNPVVFTASCSGGGSLSYVSSNGLSGTSSPINVPTTTAGTVSYSVVCVNGGCVSPTTIVSVIVASPTNQPPVLVSGGIPSPQSGTVGVGFSSTVATAFADNDGNTLTFTSTPLPAGLNISQAGVISGTPTVAGTTSVTVTANDGQGGSVSDDLVLIISPANQPPSLVGSGIASPQTATVNTSFSTPTAYAFNDPDGGPLSYSATGLPNGLAINSGNGIISGVPSVTGSFGVTVTARDPQGASVSSTFTLNVISQTAPNQAPQPTGTPLANPQSGTVGVAFSTTTAGAFTDPDGGPLSYSATGLPNGVSINPTTGVISGTPTQSGSFPVIVSATDPQGSSVATGFTLNIAPANQAPVVNGTLTSPQFATVNTTFLTNTSTVFTDPDGGPLSYSATGLPAGLSIGNTNGIISGAPSVSGTFPITVTASDPQGANASASFTLVVAPQNTPNQAPQLTGTPLANPQSGTVGVAFSTTTAGAFTDPDGGPLSFTATGLPNGVSINPTTGVISGTPTQSGSFPVVVIASDPQGSAASTGFTLNIAPTNQTPVLVGSGINSPQSATVGQAFVTPTAYAFNDPDGGPLSYSATGLPAGLGINSTNGIISGVPSVSGVFAVTVTATDPANAGVSSTFVLNVSPQAVANQAPQLTGTPLANPQSGTVGVAFSTTTAGAFTDPDGGPLSYSATGLPNGVSISPTTGVISGTPTQSGSFPVIVMATDPQGAMASTGFTLNITPANQSPVVANGGLASPQTATVNTAFVTPTAYAFNDPDGGPLSYSATGLPTGLSINPANGIISGSASVTGVFAVTVTARDPQGASASSSFVLNVVSQAVQNLAPQVVGTLTSPQFATLSAAFSTTTAGAFFDVDPLVFTASGLPAGLNINPSTGVISGAPSVTGNFPITITATDPQNASATTAFTLIVNPASVVTAPLGVTVVSYNCVTGDIVFGRTGGDPNRPVEYLAIGVKGWSTLASGRIESELRSDPNQSSITVFIRYVGEGSASASYAFNFRTFCAGQGNQPPVYNGTLANQTGTVGVPFTYTFPANAFTDPEGQGLTFTATGLPAGVSLAGQTLSGTPQLQGVYAVTIMAMDPQGASQTGTFTITINPAPVVGGPLAATVLSYNCQTGDIVFGRVGGDPNRTVEYMAIGVRGYSTNPNARIENELRSDQNQSSITVMARYAGDPASVVNYVFNFRTFCGNQSNQPPVYNGGLPNLTGTVGVPFSYTLPANLFTDPEGQSVTFSASGLPAGLSLTGRVITGTPTQQGVYTPVTIVAQDPQGGTAQATTTFTVNPAGSGNQAPVVTGTIPSQTATVGIFFTYTIPGNIFTDPEGQPLTYTISGAPRRLDVNGNVISGFPLLNGNYQITVTATDPQGGSASTSFLLTVLPNNTCGSSPTTLGQTLQLLQPDYNCQTGVIKFNTAGGNGSTITYSAIGITVPTTDCFDQMDTEVAQDVRNDKPNVEPFIIRAQQFGVIVQYAFDARAYCRSLRTGREAIETAPALEVTVLGNPTLDEWVDVDVRGAEGQLLRVRVAGPDGTAQGEQWVEKAGTVQRVRVQLGRQPGAYLLQVNTPVKARTVKVIRQ